MFSVILIVSLSIIALLRVVGVIPRNVDLFMIVYTSVLIAFGTYLLVVITTFYFKIYRKIKKILSLPIVKKTNEFLQREKLKERKRWWRWRF